MTQEKIKNPKQTAHIIAENDRYSIIVSLDSGLPLKFGYNPNTNKPKNSSVNNHPTRFVIFKITSLYKTRGKIRNEHHVDLASGRA